MKADAPLFGALLAVLVAAPLPLGGNRLWAWPVFALAVLALAASWLALWGLRRVEAPPALVNAWPAFILLGLWIAEQVLHLVPLPPALVGLLSPQSARLQHLTDVVGIHRATMTLSVDPFATRLAVLKGLAYVATFFLVLALVDGRRRVLVLGRVLVYSAVALSVYGVLMHLLDVKHVWFGTPLHHAKAGATYVNRNHFAGYLEMMLALGIGLLLAGLSDRPAGTWKRRLANLIEWILSPKMVLRLSLCILVIALTVTRSRMGNAAFFSSLLAAGLLGIALSRHATRSTVVLLASLVVVDMVIVGSWFGLDQLAQRIEETTVGSVEVREELAAYTVPMIRDFPLFGSGPGSFYAVFPLYRPESVVGFFDFAHNDYAQLAAESGLLGLALLGGFVTLTLAVAVRAHWVRRDPLMRGMSFACIMGVSAILIHSWVDFNLQIPANAMLFMVLLALGWISLHTRQGDAAIPAAPHQGKNGQNGSRSFATPSSASSANTTS